MANELAISSLAEPLPFLPYGRQVIEEDDIAAVVEALRSDWLTTGPRVGEFEAAVAAFCGARHGVAVSSGTAALHAAVHASGIGPGDEVIVPAITFVATANCVVYQGGIPVFADVESETLLIDPTEVARKITPKTKAIIAVDYAGQPCDYDALRQIADRHGLVLIADACHSLGGVYKKRQVGTLADLTVFSFHPVKHITTGEGGMVLTDDDDLAEQCRELRNLCFKPGKRFVHERLGWNLRMTNLQAALGVAQLERLDEFLEKKRIIGRVYNELLAELSGVQRPLAQTEYAENIYWVYGLVLDDSVRFDAEEAMKRLTKLGVGCRPFFYPMHQQPVLRELGLFKGESYPVAERMYQCGFYVPSGLALTIAQIEIAANLFKSLIISAKL